MTACLYVSPAGVPAIIADSLVTTSLPLHQMVLPTTIDEETTISDFEQTRLARKIYRVGPHTAFAFAGEERTIVSCLHEVRDLVHSDRNYSRPLRRIAEKANEYHASGLRMIGIQPHPHGLLQGLHKVHPQPLRVPLSILSHHAAIGSGCEELIEIAQHVNNQLSQRGRFDFFHTPQVLEALASFANGVRWSEEIVDDQVPKDWGAYYEFVSYSQEYKRYGWQFGPKFLHLFYCAYLPAVDTVSLVPVGRYIAYDPGGRNARILAIANYADVRKAFELTLENIIDPPDDPPVAAPEFWTGWSPERVSLTIISPFPGTWPFVRILDGADVGGRFSFDGKSLVLRHGGDAVQAAGQAAARAWGCQYQRSPLLEREPV